MEIKCKVGDYVGYIGKRDEKWKLTEDRINAVRLTKNNEVRLYFKNFRPLDHDEVIHNTEWLTGNNKVMLVQEPLLLTSELRARVENWIEWANENPDKATSIWK